MENKETVIIVHGTWAAPDHPAERSDPDRSSWWATWKDGVSAWIGKKPPESHAMDQPDAKPTKINHVRWYQIPPAGQQNFVSTLNKALEKKGSPARCWAHCKENSEIFSWSGTNAWIDRASAASKLAWQINKLQAEGWRCHLVAHSHGGNVVAEALPQVKVPPQAVQTIYRPTDLSGTITTLGAPFIDVISPIAHAIARRNKVYNLLAWCVISFFLLFGLWISYELLSQHGLMARDIIYTLIASMVFLSIFVLPIAFEFFWRRKKVAKTVGWCEFWKAFTIENCPDPFILSISSDVDEAWQALYHLPDIKNPLAPKCGPISYIWNSRKDYIRRSCAAERMQGIALFSDQSKLVKVIIVALWLLSLVIVTVPAGITALLLSRPIFPEAKCVADATSSIEIYHGRTESRHDAKFFVLFQDPKLLAAVKIKMSPEEKEKEAACLKKIELMPSVDPKSYPGVLLVVGVMIFVCFGLVTWTTFFVGRTFYSAMIAPIRWLARQGRATLRIFTSDIGTYIALRMGWRIVQEKALGVVGYSYGLPRAERELKFASAAIYKYEDLPEAVKRRALARRDEWFKRVFGNVTETLAKMAKPDLQALLQMVETDLSLVHAAYYIDDECIERIADWIARKA